MQGGDVMIGRLLTPRDVAELLGHWPDESLDDLSPFMGEFSVPLRPIVG